MGVLSLKHATGIPEVDSAVGWCSGKILVQRIPMVARTLLIHGSIPKESHMMHSRPTIALLLAALSVGAAPSALADRRSDDANDGIRDDSLWRERESYRTSGSSRKKCKVSETAGAITFESQLGKGGGAAYLSAWRTDWTDSFSVTFDATFSAPASSKASRAAFSGIGFGFDAESAYNVAKGFRDGVQVEMQQTKAGGRTLQIVARKNGSVIAQSAKRALAAGEHSFEVAWIANPTTRAVTLQVFLDGNVGTPFSELTGFGSLLTGRTGQGIGTSLFGYSTGNQRFASSFDDFDWFGDDHAEDGDDDDSGWDDDDDHFDDHGGHGSDDGDDDSDGSDDDGATVAQFSAALDVASGLYPDGVLLKAEAEYGWIDMVLSNPATSAEVRFVRVSAADGSVLVDSTRAPRPDEVEALVVSLLVTVDPRDALADAAATVAVGSTVHEVELESEDEGPVWEFEFVTPAGGEAEREQPAS
jgi:hypothetical protein